MPKIPTYRSRVSLPGPRYILSMDPRTGAAPYRELAKTGQALTKIGALFAARKKEVQQMGQFTELTGNAIKSINDFTLAIKDDPEWSTFNARYEELAGDIEKESRAKITDPEVAANFNHFWSRFRETNRVKVAGLADQHEILWHQNNFYNTLNQYQEWLSDPGLHDVERSQLIGQIAGLFEGGVSAGLISPEKKQTLLKQFNEQISYLKIWKIAHNLEYPKGIKWLHDPENTPGLSPSQRNSMEAALKREFGLQQDIEKRTRNAEINATQNDFLQKLFAGTLSSDDILASSLEPFGSGSKDTFMKLLDQRAKAALKDEQDPLETSDPVIKAQTFRRIHLNPESIDRQGLFDLIGHGLSTADALKAVGDLDKELSKTEPTKSSHMKRAQTMIDRARDTLGLSDREWASISDQFERRVEESGAKDEEITRIAIDLLEPKTESWLDGLWQWWSDLVTFIPSGPGESELRQRAIDVLQRNGKLVNKETIRLVMDRLREEK